MRINKFVIFVALIGVSFINAHTQTTIYSPYSRYGLGDLSTNNHSAFLAMGGLDLALGGSSNISHSNPASYVWIDSLTFLFETGINTLGVNVQTANLKGTSNYTSLSGLQLAFPVTRWWGGSIGLLPYSQMGYRLTYSDMVDSVGGLHYIFKGYGGLNQFYFGNAFKPMKNLSVGVNAAWLFGNLNKTQLVDFDSTSFFDISHKLSTVVGDLYFDFGVRYHWLLSERDIDNKRDDISLDLALVYSASADITAREDILTMTVLANAATGYEYPKDTIINIKGQKNSLLIPQKLGGGFGLRVGDRWMFGAQYTLQDWSKFSYNGIPDSLENSYQFNIGGQFAPDLKSSTYWKRIRYRAGFRYNQTYLNLRETPLTEYGMSFGFGIPFRNDQKTAETLLNVGVELGKRGTTENNLVQENYARVSFGITVNELWFFKRKYD